MLLNRRVFVSPLAFRMGLTGLKMRFGLGDLDRGYKTRFRFRFLPLLGGGLDDAPCACTVGRARRCGDAAVAELHAEGF